MNVVFFGTPHFVIPVLDSLDQHFELVGIVTTPDVITGRKKMLTPTPVKAHFRKINPEGLIIDSEKLSENDIRALKKLQPDVFVVAAYGHLVSDSILEIPPHGSLNIHPSLLPKYRGPSPIQTTLLQGDEITGVTIIKMDSEIDHGPIVAQKEIYVKPDDTFESLHVSLFREAATMLPSVIRDYVSGKIQPQEQDHTKATYCDHITREDGFIDSNNPPTQMQLNRMIRAYFPWPTAWTKITLKGKKLRIKLLPNKRVQLEGGKPMSVKDLYNGHPELKTVLSKIWGE